MQYKEFLKTGIDLAPLGWEKRSDPVAYFCTPRGARIIGNAGVDGIHYCFIRGFGETVFTVSPMNEPGEYVHPIARSWEDLLRLLLTCGDMAALEQAHGWSREHFDTFLTEYTPNEAQQAVLNAIRAASGLAPLKDPYGYIHEVQAGFDYSELRFSEEYYELFPDAPKPAWKVCYRGGFWSREGEAGKEIPIGKSFRWGEYTWWLPAVYACEEGLVFDFCVEVEPEKIRAFLDKWYPILSGDPRVSREVREQMEVENPMELPAFHTALTADGNTLREESSSGIRWIPEDCLPEDMANQPEETDLISHYCLNPARGWVFRRSRFPWNQPMEISKLELEMIAMPQTIPGICFSTPAVGSEIRFTHPVHGTEHLLTVTAREHAKMEKGSFDEMWEFPSHYTQFTYTLSPDLSNRQLTIRDTAQSDEPRLIPNPSEQFKGAASIGIIGGADGPTAVIFTHTGEPSIHSACSSLRFEPAEDVTWQMVFHEKLLENITVPLL